MPVAIPWSNVPGRPPPPALDFFWERFGHLIHLSEGVHQLLASLGELGYRSLGKTFHFIRFRTLLKLPPFDVLHVDADGWRPYACRNNRRLEAVR